VSGTRAILGDSVAAGVDEHGGELLIVEPDPVAQRSIVEP